MNLKLLFISALFSFGYVKSAKKKPKSVTTVVDAKWEVTPLVLEIAEYISDENPSLFWKFVDHICSIHPPLVDEENEKSYHDRALVEARIFLSNAQISVLKFALSLHIYSPRVEMFNQIAGERRVVCPTAADVAGNFVCDVNILETTIQKTLDSKGKEEIEILRLDHVYPRSESKLVVVLYGVLGTPEFSAFHKILKEKAVKGEIKYIIRHWVKERKHRKLRLSGYGVELQMKSTEYKVQDDAKVEGEACEESAEEEEEVEGFNFSKLRQLYPDKTVELEKLRQELLESSSELAPLKVWQFQELSLQAAQRIMSAPKDESLNVMIHIAQNFPTQARSLVKTVVSPELKNEMRQNQDRFSSTLHLQPSDTALFINGMYFDFESQDIFTILEYIRKELRVMEGLYDIGITEKKVFKALLGLDLGNSGGDYALDIRDSSVMWLNDIETDKQYRRWSTSLLDLLRPTFPGMLRSIRKNLYNLVVIGDPSDKTVRPLIKLLQSFLIHSAPLRLGIIFALSETKTGLEDSGVALLNAFNYISEIKDGSQALNFLTDVYASVGDLDITPEDVKTLLKDKFPGVMTDEVFGPDSDYYTGVKLAADYVQRSGLRNLPKVLLNGVPLPQKSLTADDFEESVLTEIMSQTPSLQKAIYRGDLTDQQNVVDYLMMLPNVMPRLNERVLSTSKNKFIDLSRNNDIISKFIDQYMFYATNKVHSRKEIYLMTNWIICDLSTNSGRSLLSSAIQQMESSGSIRIGIIINEGQSKKDYQRINKIAVTAMNMLTSDDATVELQNIIADYKEIENGAKGIENYGLKKSDLESANEIIQMHAQFVQEILQLENGQRGILSNGRLLGPFEEDEDFTPDDFGLLERFSLLAHVDKIHKAITTNSDDDLILSSDMLMKSVSLLASRPESKSRFEISPFGEEHSVVKLMSSSEQPSFDFVAIVDPVSHGAHKLGTVLSILQHVVNCDIRIFLNSVEKNSDMPLKSFYRYVLEPHIHFTSNGEKSQGPMARFSNMPGTPLLTQNMLVPDNWMVESIASPHDLDNIRLDQVDSNVHSKFELEYLILEGHCFDTTLGSPPRGLQITLGTDSAPTLFDTIVMANLGYFQLKANPGAWKLRLRHGRSESLFDIAGYSHENVDFTVNSSEIKALLSSFRAHTIKLRVSKKADKMGMDLLGEDTEEQQGLWGSITSTFTGSKDDTKDPSDEFINIFSVASGHLYERFIRIMMLSVLKHTKSPVKFWFLKNYLSPTLKDFLPRMAKQYGFEFELVQYKWPRWLHQQTEKQRIIWGYKILFLDVLFPLDVKKIIFVDADQVVRADLKELVDLDLGGAPYGYTPFCDSRVEMDGFRFWKFGYWRNHLQGRKYHISALYVVDLKKFRRIAAGDRLRGQYQALSQDPNSLSNLDQDLPNNMIHQVAIKSLPQEWLWCETWCDNASKERAKTIDLCNNPLTKEAKLTAAMRIVPEWKDYDNEMKQLQLRLGATEDHEEEHVQQDPLKKTHQHTEL